MTSSTDALESTNETYNRNRNQPRNASKKNCRTYLYLTLSALGIVFGDLGTSPLYVLNTVFSEIPEPSREQCLGAVSLIIWVLILLVTVKYALFILMADNQGEGGTFALCGLLTGDRSRLSTRAKHLISVISIFGASLVIGDGALTPAISVLSAVEGISTTSTVLTPWILPISVVIILMLFFIQMFGTSKIGLTFGPIMIVWFTTIFILGLWRITLEPHILYAFNPWEAISYLIRERKRGFIQIGGVFLAATGLEALYADLGHFGPGPVRISWLFFVFPSVMANYLGQGALLMKDPALASSPFFNLSPPWFRWPLILLATLATGIASQAIITGVFSLMNQAASLGYAPPLRIIHTSEKMFGQIYVPAINWIVMLITLWITFHFRRSEKIADAFGLTVCLVMVITTILYMCLIRYVWNRHWICVVLFGIFLVIDLIFLAANTMKFLEGAWVALVVAISFSILGISWYYGQSVLRRYLHGHARTTTLEQLPDRLGLPRITFHHLSHSHSIEIDHEVGSSDDDEKEDAVRPTRPILLIASSSSNGKTDSHESLEDEEKEALKNDDEQDQPGLPRKMTFTVTSGLGVFLTTATRHTPHVFERVLDQIHACPRMAIFLKFEYARIPYVKTEQRLKIRTYASGPQQIYHITARYGYCEHKIDLMEILKLAAEEYGLNIPDKRHITFFAPAINVRVVRKGWRALPSKWFLQLYSVLKHLFPYGQKNLRYPPDLTVTVGIVVPL